MHGRSRSARSGKPLPIPRRRRPRRYKRDAGTDPTGSVIVNEAQGGSRTRRAEEERVVLKIRRASDIQFADGAGRDRRGAGNKRIDRSRPEHTETGARESLPRGTRDAERQDAKSAQETSKHLVFHNLIGVRGGGESEEMDEGNLNVPVFGNICLQ